MSMFNQPGQAPAQPIDDETLGSQRSRIVRHPVLKWQSVGTFVEFALIDLNDQAPLKNEGVQKVIRLGDGSEKLATQDVLTGFVLGGTALYSPPEDDNRLDVVTPELVVTQFVAGHNRWDPNRAQHQGMSWRTALDKLGRQPTVGDLVRIDYVEFLEVASNGRKLQNGKKVLAFQARPLGGTPQEVEILEKVRAARRAIKNAPAAPPQSSFRPVASAPVVPAQPQAAVVPQPQAAPTRGLFE